MSAPTLDVPELFNTLESNKNEDVKEILQKIGEMFNSIKDSWLVNGFVDYYINTGSLRAVDLLIKVPVPHDKYLFDRLSDGLKGPKKCESLDLLGHIVRRQPSWLFKITKYSLFKDLLNLLKHEKEIVPLMNGLLILITLLPMIPQLISNFFQDIFDVFGRLAAFEIYRAAEYLEGYREHLQMGLYGLFHTLYGMFPCNFVDYLHREYSRKENVEIFAHTIKPMLETVKVHPFLITASKTSETENSRWKKVEHHDVLIECRRFSSEGTNRSKRDMDDYGQFRSRCGTDVSSLSLANNILQNMASNSTPNLSEGTVLGIGYKCEKFEPGKEGWFSLWEACGASSTPSAPQTPLPLPYPIQDTPLAHPHSYTPLSLKQDSGSPPEAAIEATPENTPIKDLYKDTRQRFNFPVNSSPVVRALGTRLSQPLQQLTSSYSQPPSPLKKESSPFSRMSSVEAGGATDETKKDSYYTQHKISRILQDRSQQTSDPSTVSSPHKHISASPLKKIPVKDPAYLVGVPSVPNSPVPLGTAAPTSGSTDWPLAKPKPHKDGVPFDITSGRDNISNLNILPNVVENMKEDKEIVELSKRGEVMRSTSIIRDAHLVLSETDLKLNYRGGSRLQDDKLEDCDGHWTDGDVICESTDKFCNDKKHGLHMPNTSSALLDIAKRYTKTRSRYYSHCIIESSKTVVKHDTDTQKGHQKKHVARRNSCPNFSHVLYESTKEENRCTTTVDINKHANVQTQTINVWPTSFDILFNEQIQKFCEQNKFDDVDDRCPPVPFSPYSQVDRYIEILSKKSFSQIAVPSQRSSKDEIEYLRLKLELSQLELMYERFRREVHAVRNRRLLGRSRKNREAEEQNVALKQQVMAQQQEIEELRQQLTRQNQKNQVMEQKYGENKKYWQHQILLIEKELQTVVKEKEKLAGQLLDMQNISIETSADVQHLHSALFEVSQQLIKANRKSEMCDRLMECIKRMQRELVMFGEKDARFSTFANIPTKADALVNKITQQYKEQILNAQALLQAQTSKMDYLQARETELESAILKKERAAQELKKQLIVINEEYNERLLAVEDKYNAVKKINQSMEAHCLELLQKIPQSPQTISRDITSGFSPQSSPLSASLASSEGHGPLLASRVDEIRNLQVIVNAHETIEESTSNTLVFDEDNH